MKCRLLFPPSVICVFVDVLNVVILPPLAIVFLMSLELFFLFSYFAKKKGGSFIYVRALKVEQVLLSSQYYQYYEIGIKISYFIFENSPLRYLSVLSYFCNPSISTSDE